MSEVLPEAITALRLRGKSVSLRWLLALPVAVQLVGAIGLMSWLAWNHANQSLTEASSRLRQEMTLRISQFLEGSLQAPLQVVQLMAQDSQTGRVDFRDEADRERRLIEYFEVFKGTVDNVAYGGLDGEFTSVQFTDDRTSRQLQVAGRSTGGKMLGFDLDRSRKLSTESPTFDPRQRSWYQDTIRHQRLVWNSVFQLHSSPQILALPVSQPVRDRAGQVIGVVTSRLYLSAVSQFLRTLPIGPSGLAFIMEQDGQLIATSTGTPLVWLDRPQPSRLRADESANPVIQATAQYLQLPMSPAAARPDRPGHSDPLATRLTTLNQQFTVNVRGETHLGQVAHFQNAAGLQWWIVIVLPERDVYAPIAAQLRATLLVCLVMLLIVAVGGGWMTQRLAKPLQQLVLAAEGLAKGHWSDRARRSMITEIDRLASAFNGMTEQLAHSFQTLDHQARHDPLTDLPNRYTLLQAITQQIDRQTPGAIGHPSAILHIDLDDFKLVNDSLGHWVGDQVLTLMAQRLRANLLPGEILARFGGDEFTLLVTNLAANEGGIERAEHLQKLLSAPFDLGELEIFVRVSIGITEVDRRLEAETLLRQAEIALYAAKQHGKGTCVLFRPEMHSQVVMRFQLASDLQRALPRQQLVMHYQPIVSLETEQIQGFEALMRWYHPQRGSIPPTEFVPIAEETGIIVELGLWALREACKQHQIWRDRHPWCANTRISVNCSIRQLMGTDFVAQVEAILQETGLPPTLLSLEITESLLLHLSPELRSTLDRLAIIGIRLIIDDFGTGYSSLSYLHQLPLYGLKIDQSFIYNLDRQDRSQAIVAAIVNLADRLDLITTAEGAETTASTKVLQELGCTNVQGFVFSPATAPHTLEAWMLSWQKRLRATRSHLRLVSPTPTDTDHYPITNRPLINTINRTLNYAADRVDPDDAIDPDDPTDFA